jgi:hypothetical protein
MFANDLRADRAVEEKKRSFLSGEQSCCPSAVSNGTFSAEMHHLTRASNSSKTYLPADDSGFLALVKLRRLSWHNESARWANWMIWAG